MMASSPLITILTLAFVVTCWVTDVRSRRIPNLLSLGALLVGVAVNGILLGKSGLIAAASGGLICMAVLFPPFALGGVGGGDVKMMGAVGALLGPRLGMYALAAGLILGGLVALVQLRRLGRLGEKLGATWRRLSSSLRHGSLDPLRLSADEPDAVALPYSIPLGLGTLIVVAGG